MEPVIRVNNLVREFKVAVRDKNFFRYLFLRKHRIVRAVDGASFDVARGELVGYIGPNGAGKSTTIKMLTGPCVWLQSRREKCSLSSVHINQAGL